MGFATCEFTLQVLLHALDLKEHYRGFFLVTVVLSVLFFLLAPNGSDSAIEGVHSIASLLIWISARMYSHIRLLRF